MWSTVLISWICACTILCLEVSDASTQQRWSKILRSKLRLAKRPELNSNKTNNSVQPAESRSLGNFKLRVIDHETPIASAIVFGGNSRPGHWPFMAFYRLPDKSQCGGVVLSEEWILTAAHCFDQYSPSEILIGAYRNDGKDKNAVKRGVESKYCHEDYDDLTLSNDICLIKLSSPVQFTKHIQKGKLPPPNANLQDGQNCTIMGWGLNERNQLLPELQEANVEVINKAQCIAWYSSVHVAVPDNHFCAGLPGGGSDTCNGDSGGPLVIQQNGIYIIRGITSFGPTKCGTKQRPGVYTNVSKYRTWINEQIKKPREVFTWSDWTTKCSVTCGTGVLTKTRQCQDQNGDLANNKLCSTGKALEFDVCTLKQCSPVYTWSKWNVRCSVTCGSGREIRKRDCLGNDGEIVAHNLCGKGGRSRQSKCSLLPCREDSGSSGSFHHWGQWKTSCTVTCGEGKKVSIRECLNRNFQRVSATLCPGRQYKRGKCKRRPCQGQDTLQWGEWKRWSTCKLRIIPKGPCDGFRSSTRRCLEGNEKVKAERCIRALGGNIYRNSPCIPAGC